MILSQGSPKSQTQSALMNRGTNGAGETWYCGAQNQTSLAAPSISVNFLRSYPIVLSRAVILTKISFEQVVAGGAGSKTRVGIYNAMSLANIYPNALVVDSGEFATDGANAVKTTAGLSIFMPPGIYWLSHISGISAATLRALSGAGSASLSLLGSTNSLNGLGFNLAPSLVYGALPSTFPAGAILSAATLPLVALGVN